MFLYAEQHVSGYEWDDSETREAYAAVVDAVGLTDAADPGTPSAYVKVCIGYSPTVNAVHAWIVDNCADGRDECQEIHVTPDDLARLRSLCSEAINAYDEQRWDGLRDLLPRDYGEWYRRDLVHTKQLLDKAIVLAENYTITYRASW